MKLTRWHKLPPPRFTGADFLTVMALALLGVVLVFLFTGCAQISYTATKPDGTRVTASAASLFSRNAIKGFNTDSTTEKTSTGLKFTHSETSPELEALGALIGAAIKTAK